MELVLATALNASMSISFLKLRRHSMRQTRSFEWLTASQAGPLHYVSLPLYCIQDRFRNGTCQEFARLVLDLRLSGGELQAPRLLSICSPILLHFLNVLLAASSLPSNARIWSVKLHRSSGSGASDEALLFAFQTSPTNEWEPTSLDNGGLTRDSVL